MGLITNSKSPKKFNLTSQSLKEIEPGNKMYYNMTAKDGKVTVPTVKAGDEVKAFQVIGETEDKSLATVFSTVSGKVEKILISPDNQGKMVSTVVIENDKNYSKAEENQGSHITLEFFLNRLKKYALTDSKGNMLYETFETLKTETGTTIIINAAPWDKDSLTHLYILKEEISKINDALSTIKKLFGSTVYLTVNKNEITDLNIGNDVIVKNVSRSYNSQMKKELIKDTLGENNDAIIITLKDLLNIYECVTSNEPKSYEIITITKPNKETVNCKVLIGTSLKDVLQALNINEADVDKIVRNGLLTGQAVISIDVPIISGTESLAFINDTKSVKERPCIRCGECLKACPENLNPIKLAEYLKRNDIESFKSYGGGKCAECGLCSYACPSKINLANKIALGKSL